MADEQNPEMRDDDTENEQNPRSSRQHQHQPPDQGANAIITDDTQEVKKKKEKSSFWSKLFGSKKDKESHPGVEHAATHSPEDLAEEQGSPNGVSKKKEKTSLSSKLIFWKNRKRGGADICQSETHPSEEQKDEQATPTANGDAQEQVRLEDMHGLKPGSSTHCDKSVDESHSQKTPPYEQSQIEQDNENSDSSDGYERFGHQDFGCFILEPISNNEVYGRAIKQFFKSVQEFVTARQIKLVHKYVSANEDVKGEVATRPSTLFVPCLATTNVDNAMTIVLDKVGLTREHHKLAVVFHPRATHDTSVPPSRKQVAAQVRDCCHLIVDVVFNRQTGDNYPDRMTQGAVEEIGEYITQAVEN